MPAVSNSTVASSVSGQKSANPDSILRRLGQLKSDRTGLENIIRECYDHTYPLRGGNLWVPDGTSAGASGVQNLAAIKQAELLDTTGTESSRILASALMSGLTPANSRWAESWVEHADESDKAWLDQGSTTVWEWIHKSNFDAVAFECMLDMVISGMFAMFVDEVSPEDGGGYEFEQWPMASTWFASSAPSKPIDTFYREMYLTAEQAINYYGIERVDKMVRDAASTNPDKKFLYVWAIYPRQGANGRLAQTMPYASCHVEAHSKVLIRESGYHECPIVAPRWQMIPQSVYANGPVFEALPTIKQLNQVIRLNMAGLEMNVGGMWIAKDDGVLNPHTIRVGPRKIIVAADTDAMKPLIDATDMSKVLMTIEGLQKQIKSTMMADHLEPQTRPGEQQTAYEVHVRVELIRQLLGPTYGRLQSEYLSMMWKRCWGLAFRAGELGPAPPGLRNRSYTVKYVSPLARAQRGVDLAAMDRYEVATLQQTQLDPNVLDNYNVDEANRLRAELGGVPSKLMRSRDEVEAMRAKAEQQRQADQAQANSTEALMQSIKGNGGDGNGMAMAALAAQMAKPKKFMKQGREIVGIQ